MRRWSGQVAQWSLDFRAISYEDNQDLSNLLTRQPDPIMESLANSIMFDTVIVNSPSYVWVTNGSDIHGLNLRLRSQDTVGANFLTANNVNVISVFTYVTFGPTGHGLQPNR